MDTYLGKFVSMGPQAQCHSSPKYWDIVVSTSSLMSNTSLQGYRRLWPIKQSAEITHLIQLVKRFFQKIVRLRLHHRVDLTVESYTSSVPIVKLSPHKDSDHASHYHFHFDVLMPLKCDLCMVEDAHSHWDPTTGVDPHPLPPRTKLWELKCFKHDRASLNR